MALHEESWWWRIFLCFGDAAAADPTSLIVGLAMCTPAVLVDGVLRLVCFDSRMFTAVSDVSYSKALALGG